MSTPYAAGQRSQIVLVQQILFNGLVSIDALKTVNIMLRRRMRQDSELREDAIWLTPRNGCSGAGIVVEMPELADPDPAAPGPQMLMKARCMILEEPNMNHMPGTGTLIDAELIAELVWRFGHQWFTQSFGELYAANYRPAPDSIYPGRIAYEVEWSMYLSSDWISRVTAAVLTVADPAVTCTLTKAAAFPWSTIWYTLDDTPPSDNTVAGDLGNPSAVKYAGPFQADPGTILQWFATNPGYLPSAINRVTLNA